MLQNHYHRKYSCQQIDQEVERIKQAHPWVWSRQDQLLVDAAEVQILLGNDQAALDLLGKCFAAVSLITEWEQAAENSKY